MGQPVTRLLASSSPFFLPFPRSSHSPLSFAHSRSPLSDVSLSLFSHVHRALLKANNFTSRRCGERQAILERPTRDEETAGEKGRKRAEGELIDAEVIDRRRAGRHTCVPFDMCLLSSKNAIMSMYDEFLISRKQGKSARRLGLIFLNVLHFLRVIRRRISI